MDALIRYRDNEGEVTERRILVIRFDLEQGRIKAICHLRNQLRTFRCDRIISFIDLDSGEVIDDVYLYLFKIYQAEAA